MNYTNHRHPCFNAEASGSFARIHLPVAHGCNIQCNYCSRKNDCANETRPGVTSRLLSPREALELVERVVQDIPQLSVAAVAGPGEPLASQNTLEALRLVRDRFIDLELCLSTNGLNVRKTIGQILDVGVKFVTVTINAVSPQVGSKIYSWINYGGKVLRGEEAFKVLNYEQIAGLHELVRAKITTKVNIVLIPGINDFHIDQVVQTIADIGVDMCNIVPLIPVPGTPFENIPRPSGSCLVNARNKAAHVLPQMLHCSQCRADAIGFLDGGQSGGCAGASLDEKPRRMRAAVATDSGIVIDQHFGHSSSFLIYDVVGNDVVFVERRYVTPFCVSKERGNEEEQLRAMQTVIGDCNVVLSQKIGRFPAIELERLGLAVIESSGLISDVLRQAPFLEGSVDLPGRMLGVS